MFAKAKYYTYIKNTATNSSVHIRQLATGDKMDFPDFSSFYL